MSEDWTLQTFDNRNWWTIRLASEAEIKAQFQGLIFQSGVYRVLNYAGHEIVRVMSIGGDRP